jgi:hypothetical protein
VDCVTEISNCAIETYALYECKLDYSDCNPLPLRYTTDIGADTLDLKADKTANEINLIRQKPSGLSNLNLRIKVL